jgi:hypothetical protein
VKPFAAEPAKQILPASGLGQRIRGHAKQSLPSISETFVGSTPWGGAMAGSAALGILMQDWETTEKVQSVAVFYTLGGALAFPVGLLVARLLSLGRSVEVAFAASGRVPAFFRGGHLVCKNAALRIRPRSVRTRILSSSNQGPL